MNIGIRNFKSFFSACGFELQSMTTATRKNAHTYWLVSGGAVRIRITPFTKVIHLSSFKKGDAINERRFTKHQKYASNEMTVEGMGINLLIKPAIVDKALLPDDFFAENPSVFLMHVMMHEGPPKKKEGIIISTEK